MCRPDDYPPHDDPHPCPVCGAAVYGHPGPHRAPCALATTDADRYAEAIAGARAMRERARQWADYTDTPAIRPGADADERRHGIPPWPAIDTE